MSTRLSAALLTLALTASVTGLASAQTTRSHLGPHVGYNFDIDKFGVGAQVSVPVASHLEFYPSFDYWLVDAGSLWAVNADLKYRLTGAGWNWLYVGSGLNITTAGGGGASSSQTGLNLFAGIESLRGSVHPYAEFRAVVGKGSTTQVAAGLNFTLGRH